MGALRRAHLRQLDRRHRLVDARLVDKVVARMKRSAIRDR
jgi:hypothetical protein